MNHPLFLRLRNWAQASLFYRDGRVNFWGWDLQLLAVLAIIAGGYLSMQLAAQEKYFFAVGFYSRDVMSSQTVLLLQVVALSAIYAIVYILDASMVPSRIHAGWTSNVMIALGVGSIMLAFVSVTGLDLLHDWIEFFGFDGLFTGAHPSSSDVARGDEVYQMMSAGQWAARSSVGSITQITPESYLEVATNSWMYYTSIAMAAVRPFAFYMFNIVERTPRSAVTALP